MGDVSFNWVKARDRCCYREVFEALGQQVERDVAAANELRRSTLTFRLTQQGNSFAAVRVRDLGGIQEAHSVSFELAAQQIEVSRRSPAGKQTPLFAARPLLTEEGVCKIEIVGNAAPPLELWQVSRRALEDLFFDLE